MVTCWALPCLYNESWCWSHTEFGLSHSLCPDPCRLVSPETHWADSVQTLSPYVNHTVRPELCRALSPDPCHMLNSNHKIIVTPESICMLRHDHGITLRPDLDHTLSCNLGHKLRSNPKHMLNTNSGHKLTTTSALMLIPYPTDMLNSNIGCTTMVVIGTTDFGHRLIPDSKLDSSCSLVWPCTYPETLSLAPLTCWGLIPLICWALTLVIHRYFSLFKYWTWSYPAHWH